MQLLFFSKLSTRLQMIHTDDPHRWSTQMIHTPSIKIVVGVCLIYICMLQATSSSIHLLLVWFQKGASKTTRHNISLAVMMDATVICSWLFFRHFLCFLCCTNVTCANAKWQKQKPAEHISPVMKTDLTVVWRKVLLFWLRVFHVTLLSTHLKIHRKWNELKVKMNESHTCNKL